MNTTLLEIPLPSGVIIQLVQGDITVEKTDAIVNAANEYLQHGAGVAGAIARRGGPVIQTESEAWIKQHGLVSHESPAWTSGGRLPARYVIHAVGPVWGDNQSEDAGWNEDAKLAAAVTGCLRVAEELHLTSIALPAISTGIFGFPKDRAAGIILQSIEKYFLETPGSSIRLVRLVLYDQTTMTSFIKVWDDHFGTKP
jgi:O-acetyl-ADP-ribose deacetylase (regulator of RNase III)